MPRITAGALRALTVGAVAVGGLLVAAPAQAAPVAPIFNEAIDEYADYDGADTCDPTDKPGVQAFRDLLHETYPETGVGGISRQCGSGTSEHYEGRAYDWPLDARSQSHIADDLFAWLFATDSYGHRNAMIRRLGIMYIIWNREMWRAYDPDEGWQPYDGSNPHTDHVHFSFSWDGALERTTFSTGVDAALRLDQARFAATWKDRHRIDVFRRANGGQLEQSTWEGAGFSPWKGVDGGEIRSAPAAAWMGNRLVVVALDPDDRLVMRQWRGGDWTGWRRISGPRMTSAPALAVRSGRLDVFVRDQDAAVAHKVWTKKHGWTSWRVLGGPTTSAPSAVWQSRGILHVFGRGVADDLYVRTRDHGQWTEWSSQGGRLSSGPSASRGGPGTANVFVRGTDGATHQKYWADGWSAWRTMGGAHSSGPSATNLGPGRVDVFTRAPSGGLNQNVYIRDVGWSGWRVVGMTGGAP